MSTNRTCASGVLKIPVNFTKPLSIVSVLPFGAQYRRSGSLVLIFFEENELAVTVNAARYREMIDECFLPHPEEMDVGDVSFQQDGATAHTVPASMELLREHFPGRLISLRGDLPWPARSPDLAPFDFFLWGYLKSIVYNDRPRTACRHLAEKLCTTWPLSRNPFASLV